MKRSDLEHIIRAVGDLLGEEQVIVVGSQSILASYSEEVLPLEAARSLEADVLPLDDLSGAKADLIEGSLGEFSPFDEQFGVHVDGVSEDTSILPNGWRHRLIAFSNANTNGVTGLCLERHDLCVAKLVANREKDREFVASLLRPSSSTRTSSSSGSMSQESGLNASRISMRLSEPALGQGTKAEAERPFRGRAAAAKAWGNLTGWSSRRPMGAAPPKQLQPEDLQASGDCCRTPRSVPLPRSPPHGEHPGCLKPVLPPARADGQTG